MCTLFSCKGCNDILLRFQQMTSPQWQNLEQREAYQRLIETVSVLHRLATRLSSRAEIVGAVRQVQLNKHMQMTVQMEKVQGSLLQDVLWCYFKMTAKIVVWFPSVTDNIIIKLSCTESKAPVKWRPWSSSNIKKSLESLDLCLYQLKRNVWLCQLYFHSSPQRAIVQILCCRLTLTDYVLCNRRNAWTRPLRLWCNT